MESEKESIIESKFKNPMNYIIVFVILGLLASIFVLGFSSNNQIVQTSVSGGLERHGQVCVSQYQREGNRDDGAIIPSSYKNLGCSDNLVVTAGLNAVRDILGRNADFGNFTFIGLCNASAFCNSPGAADTVIENEFNATGGLNRSAGGYALLGTGNWSIYKEFTTTSYANILTNKTCLFNQSAGGTMLACNTFSLATLDGTQSDRILINWTNFVVSGQG